MLNPFSLTIPEQFQLGLDTTLDFRQSPPALDLNWLDDHSMITTDHLIPNHFLIVILGPIIFKEIATNFTIISAHFLTWGSAGCNPSRKRLYTVCCILLDQSSIAPRVRCIKSPWCWHLKRTIQSPRESM